MYFSHLTFYSLSLSLTSQSPHFPAPLLLSLIIHYHNLIYLLPATLCHYHLPNNNILPPFHFSSLFYHLSLFLISFTSIYILHPPLSIHHNFISIYSYFTIYTTSILSLFTSTNLTTHPILTTTSSLPTSSLPTLPSFLHILPHTPPYPH